jgi:hypothetical protein
VTFVEGPKNQIELTVPTAVLNRHLGPPNVSSFTCVPQPVLAEIEYGLERLPRSARRERLRARFHAIK